MLNQRSDRPRPFYRYPNVADHRPQAYPLDLGSNSSAEAPLPKLTENRSSPDPSIPTEKAVDTWESRAKLLGQLGDNLNAKVKQALKVTTIESESI